MENCCNITDFSLGFQNPVCCFLPSFYKHHPGFYIILDDYCALIIYNKDGLKKLHTYFYMTCFLCFKKEFKKIIIKLNYLATSSKWTTFERGHKKPRTNKPPLPRRYAPNFDRAFLFLFNNFFPMPHYTNDLFAVRDSDGTDIDHNPKSVFVNKMGLRQVFGIFKSNFQSEAMLNCDSERTKEF